jgi:hypothetical protein
MSIHPIITSAVTPCILLCLVHNSPEEMKHHETINEAIAESPLAPFVKDRVTQVNGGYTTPTPLILKRTELLLADDPDYPETVFPSLCRRRYDEQKGGYAYFNYEPESGVRSDRFDACVRPYTTAELSFTARCVSQMRRLDPTRKLGIWNCPHLISNADWDAARMIRGVSYINWSIYNAYHADPMRAIYDYGKIDREFDHEVSIAIKPTFGTEWVDTQTAINFGRVIGHAARERGGSGMLYLPAGLFKDGVPPQFNAWLGGLAEGLAA